MTFKDSEHCDISQDIEKPACKTPTSDLTFKDLDLHSDILRAVEESGYQIPTPIQKETIPVILQKKDICACAPTGTGKTAAFILPILHQIISSPKPGRGPRALILVPTRELAIQVSSQAEKYSRHLENVTTVCIYGGVPYPVQKKSLSSPYEILVATPGRLIDHLERGRIKLSRVEILILDEADRMLDMGFIEPVEEIASRTPKERQTLMFSATLKESVIRLAKDLLNDPVKITVTAPKETHDHIEQKMHKVDNLEHKHRLLEHILKDPSIQNALIFTSTKIYADTLQEMLEDMDLRVGVLHGDIPQKKRTYTISQFRKGKIQILVATDVAARGIDVPTLSHVINFDLPNNATDYIHRIGRTGRAGASGVALSFVSYKDMPIIKDLEKALGQKITFLEIPGLEPKMNNRSRSSEFPKKSRNSRSNFRSERSNRSDRGSDRPYRSERSERPERAEVSSSERPYKARTDRPYRSERTEGSSDRPYRSERSERPEKAAEGSSSERPFKARTDRPYRSERSERSSDRPYRSERAERPERSEGSSSERPYKARTDRPYKSERSERADRPFRSERSEGSSDRPYKARTDRPSSDRPYRAGRTEGASSDRPYRSERSNRPSSDRPYRSESSDRRSEPRKSEGKDNNFFKKSFKGKKFDNKPFFGKNHSSGRSHKSP